MIDRVAIAVFISILSKYVRQRAHFIQELRTLAGDTLRETGS